MSVCITLKRVSYGYFPLSCTNCAYDKKYSLLIGRSQNSLSKQNSTYSIQWLTLRPELMRVDLIYRIFLRMSN